MCVIIRHTRTSIAAAPPPPTPQRQVASGCIARATSKQQTWGGAGVPGEKQGAKGVGGWRTDPGASLQLSNVRHLLEQLVYMKGILIQFYLFIYLFLL